MSTYAFPTETTIKKMLSDLLARDLKMSFVKKWDVGLDSLYAVATYDDKDKKMPVIAVVDIIAAGYLGGALTLIPANTIAEQVKSKELSENVFANIYEVLNIMACLLNSNSTKHLKLIDVKKAKEVNGEQLSHYFNSPQQQLHAEIDIPDLGKGRLSVFQYLSD